MNLDTKQHPYKDRKYKIVAYNPEWVKKFENYASKIRTIFPSVQVEHIGSTSVPGMSGKPCVDLLVTVPDIEFVKNKKDDMEAVGFEYAGSFVTKDSVLFRVMQDNELVANIHFFPIGHPHNIEMLSLRDYLRNHPEEVRAYSDTKNETESGESED